MDSRYLRLTEVDELLADPSHAREKLRWNPKITFKELVRIMVDADMRVLGLTPIGQGDEVLKKKFPDRWWGTD